MLVCNLQGMGDEEHSQCLCAIRREWVTRSIPALIFIGLVLYVDRVLRRDVILDSSSLMVTIFVAHLLNICRSSIAHVDILHPTAAAAAAAPASPNNVMHAQMALLHETRGMMNHAQSVLSPISSNNETAQQHQQQHLYTAALHEPHGSAIFLLSWWQEGLVYLTYAALSVLLLAGLDVVSAAVSPSSSRKSNRGRHTITHQAAALPSSFAQLACWHHPTHEQENDVRVSTVVAHCIMVGVVLQLGVDKALFMPPAKVMARSFAFTGLSILWTYADSVFHRSASVVAQATTPNRNYQQQQQQQQNIHNHQLLSLCYYVEPFTPCQLRFAVLLFLDGWMLGASALAMVAVMGRKLHAIMGRTSSSAAAADPSSSSSYYAAGCCEMKEVKKGGHHLPTSALPRASGAAAAAQSSRKRVVAAAAAAAAAGGSAMEQLHGAMPLRTAAAADLHAKPMSAAKKEQRKGKGVDSSNAEESGDDVLAMFRMAQRQAAMAASAGAAGISIQSQPLVQQQKAMEFSEASFRMVRDQRLSTERLGEML